MEENNNQAVVNENDNKENTIEPTVSVENSTNQAVVNENDNKENINEPTLAVENSTNQAVVNENDNKENINEPTVAVENNTNQAVIKEEVNTKKNKVGNIVSIIIIILAILFCVYYFVLKDKYFTKQDDVQNEDNVEEKEDTNEVEIAEEETIEKEEEPVVEDEYEEIVEDEIVKTKIIKLGNDRFSYEYTYPVGSTVPSYYYDEDEDDNIEYIEDDEDYDDDYDDEEYDEDYDDDYIDEPSGYIKNYKINDKSINSSLEVDYFSSFAVDVEKIGNYLFINISAEDFCGSIHHYLIISDFNGNIYDYTKYIDDCDSKESCLNGVNVWDYDSSGTDLGFHDYEYDKNTKLLKINYADIHDLDCDTSETISYTCKQLEKIKNTKYTAKTFTFKVDDNIKYVKTEITQLYKDSKFYKTYKKTCE